MPRHATRDPMFRYRRYEAEIIVLAVRWYISYRLSLRDLAEILAERGLKLYPSTIWRWVQRFVPEFEKRWDRLRKRVGCSWKVDETYLQVRGEWCYLHRAVDKQGQTVDFLLRRNCGIAAAQAFFRRAWRRSRSRTSHGHARRPPAEPPGTLATTARAPGMAARGDPKTRYLNNRVEQDHRAVKRRFVAMHGLKSFDAAMITIAGVELAHRIRKGQFTLGHARGARQHSMRTAWSRALFGT